MLEASLFLGLTGLAIGLLLALAAKKFKIDEDPRVEAIMSALPGANCGACGYPGCAGYAASVVGGEAPVTGCVVGGNAVAEKIAEIMGVSASSVTPSIAVVYCQGDNEQAVKAAEYSGITDCLALNLLGGDKECVYGCLGLGSCVAACPFDAIYMNEKGLPVVVAEKCTGCGLCAKACPRGVIGIVPVDKEVHVRCRSYDKGSVVSKYCKVGCIACTLCVKACPQNAITMDQGTLAKIDYSICDNCGICSTKCPVKTISYPKKAQEKAS